MNKNAKADVRSERKLREPLFHIVKRDALPWYRAWMIRGLAVVAALVFSAIVTMILTHENPFTVYATMIRGSFATPTRIWNMLQSLAMLLCVSLAVTPAFKMRFWNIGAEGQVLVGALATAACIRGAGKIHDSERGMKVLRDMAEAGNVEAREVLGVM